MEDDWDLLGGGASAPDPLSPFTAPAPSPSSSKKKSSPRKRSASDAASSAPVSIEEDNDPIELEEITAEVAATRVSQPTPPKAARVPKAPGAKVRKNAAGEESINFGSGKAAGRHFLAHYLSDRAFRTGAHPRKGEQMPSVCFEDSLQNLQMFKLKPSARRMEALKELAMEEATQDPESLLYGRDDIDVKQWMLEPVRTVVELIGMMVHAPNYGLSSRRGYDTYVMCFDKANFTPPTKGEEQADRDQDVMEQLRAERESTAVVLANYSKKVVEQDAMPHPDRRPYLVPDVGFPWDYDEALTDRQGTRKDIIRCICYHILDVKERHYTCASLYSLGVRHRGLGMAAVVPPGKRLIIDGHCLSVWDVRELAQALGQQESPFGGGGVDPTDDELYETPVMLEAHPLTGELKLRAVPSLRNRIGETDFMLFALWERLCRAPDILPDMQREFVRRAGFDITTTDTDLIYLSLFYLYKSEHLAGQQHLPPVHINCGAQSWVQRRRSPYLTTENWIDVGAMYRDLQPLGGSTQGAINYCVAAFNAGGDYMNTYPGLPLQWWALAIWHHGGYVGDLLRMRPHWESSFEEQGTEEGAALDRMIDEQEQERDAFARPPHLDFDVKAYVRLVKTTYMLSKSWVFTELKSDAKSNKALLLEPPPRGTLPARHCVALISPLRTRLDDVRAKSEKWNAETWRFPEEDVIKARGAQLNYYLCLVSQLGQNELRLPDPADYAYESQETEVPLRASQQSTPPSLRADVAASRTSTVRIWSKKKRHR